MMPYQKECSRCGRTLSVLMFHKDKSHKDGYESACSNCRMNRTRTVKIPSPMADKLKLPAEKPVDVRVDVSWFRGEWILRVASCPYCGGRHEHAGGNNPDKARLGIEDAPCNGKQYSMVTEMARTMEYAHSED